MYVYIAEGDRGLANEGRMSTHAGMAPGAVARFIRADSSIKHVAAALTGLEEGGEEWRREFQEAGGWGPLERLLVVGGARARPLRHMMRGRGRREQGHLEHLGRRGSLVPRSSSFADYHEQTREHVLLAREHVLSERAHDLVPRSSSFADYHGSLECDEGGGASGGGWVRAQDSKSTCSVGANDSTRTYSDGARNSKVGGLRYAI
jgi:hypothetical protein